MTTLPTRRWIFQIFSCIQGTPWRINYAIIDCLSLTLFNLTNYLIITLKQI